jgi:hypothetical protein
MAAISMMANILRRQLLERGLDALPDEDCEAIVLAMFDGATKLFLVSGLVSACSCLKRFSSSSIYYWSADPRALMRWRVQLVTAVSRTSPPDRIPAVFRRAIG